MTHIDCQTFSTQLDDWLDGSLSPESQLAMQAHCQGCEVCNGRWQSSRRIRHGLRHLPVPPCPRPGFVSAALRRARREAPAAPFGRSAWRDGAFALSGALAAGIGMMAVLWTRAGPSEPPAAIALPDIETVTLAEGQVEALRMRIDAARHFDKVRFSVELPEQVWLADQPGIRARTWEGELQPGENLLELPLLAVAGASGTVTARVNWGDQERRVQAQIISVAPVLLEGAVAEGQDT